MAQVKHVVDPFGEVNVYPGSGGKIRVTALEHLLLVQIGEEIVGQRIRLTGRQRRSVGPNRLQHAVQPPDRRGIDPKMNVRSARPLPNQQVIVDVHVGLRARRGFG